jgi:hypothetical protein
MLVNVYGTIQNYKMISLARWDWDLSVPLCAPSLPGTLSDCTLEKYCLPTNVLVLSIILVNLIWHLYSYCNEVVIIIIIFGRATKS